MIITLIEPSRRRRGRLLVHVDGAEPIELSRALVKQRGLRPGATLTTADADTMLAADRRREALEAAATLLARRMRSERELRRRLAMRRFPPDLVDATIEHLRGLHLIDDAEFARAWTETRDRSAPRGKRLVVQELRRLGVDLTTARAATEEISDDDAAYRLATRRARSTDATNYREFRERLGTYLVRRGFDWESAALAVDRCWRERHAGDSNEPIE